MDKDLSNTVTLVKAVGIILMVVCHALPTDLYIRSVVYTFHMPLFFLMSGYCFKDSYLDNTWQFVLRRLKGLYLPFVLFSLAFIFSHNLFYLWFNSDLVFSWKEFLLQVSDAVFRMQYNGRMLGQFWFLKQLFCGSLIFFFTLKLCRRRVGCTVLLLLVATELLCITQIGIPYFEVDYNSVYAAFFISVGCLWRKSEIKISNWLLFPVGLALILAEPLVLDKVAFLDNTPVTLLLYCLPAIAGTLMVFKLCSLWTEDAENRMQLAILYVGNHTLSILALHFLVFRFVTIMYVLLYSLPLSHLAEFPVIAESSYFWRLIYSIAGVVLPLLAVYICQRVIKKRNSV